MSIKIVMLILFISTINYAFALHPFEGSVFDKETNEPLAGAAIYIHELERGVVSDQNGKFVLRGIPEKSYRVEISFLGYETRIVKLDANKHISVGLETSLIEAPEVVVTASNFASQHENAVKIEAKRVDEIENSGSSSFAGAIASIPGVDVISKGNGIAKPLIRGMSNSNLLFLNNGVRLENYQFSENHPYVIDETGIDRVEVIKGPASLLYGADAIGGLINVLPEHPAALGTVEGDASATAYSISNGGRINVGVKQSTAGLSWGARGSLRRHRDYVDGSGQYVPNSRFSQQTAKMFMGHNSPVGFFKLSYDYSHLKPGMTNAASVDLVQQNKFAPELWYQDLKNHTLLSKNTFYIQKMKVNANLSWNKNHRVVNTAEVNVVNMALNSLGFDVKTWLPSNNTGDFILGVQGNYVDNRNFEAHAKVLPDYEKQALAFMGLYQKRIDEQLSIQVGGRYDYSSIFVPSQEKAVHNHEEDEDHHEEVGGHHDEDEEYIQKQKYSYYNGSFSAGATWQITPELLLRSNLATAFRPPNVAELTQDGVHGARYEIGDPNLETQRNYEGDVSMHYHSKYLSFDIAGFYNQIADYIYLSPVGVEVDELPLYQYSQNDASLYGGEFTVKYQPFDWVRLSSQAAVVRGKLDDGNYLPFMPHDKIETGLRLMKKRMGIFRQSFVALQGVYAFEQSRPSRFETITPAWFVTNITAGASIILSGNEINISFVVKNLFNKTYADHLSTIKSLGYYNPGRGAVMRLKWMF